jgi:hypothetical protein
VAKQISSEVGRERLESALNDVMHRFRGYFLEPGVNMTEEQVPLRNRDEFPAPLVTVLGHTYGVRLTSGEGRRRVGQPELAVEVSANVYADEFDLNEARQKLADAYRPGSFEEIVANFLTPEDEAGLGTSRPEVFGSFFSFDLEQDLALVEKTKHSASKITGRYVDLILTMRYWIVPAKMARLTKNPQLFGSAVYLYCLRVFMAACRASLMGMRGGR